MRALLEKEFDGVPHQTAEVLLDDLEDGLRLFLQQYSTSVHDPKIRQHALENLGARIFSIFTLARKFKKKSQNNS